MAQNKCALQSGLRDLGVVKHRFSNEFFVLFSFLEAETTNRVKMTDNVLI